MHSGQAVDFVDDWLCYNAILGEGAYGEVKLLVHKKTEDKLACKIINHEKYKNAAASIYREITIHKMLDHKNIIKYYGKRRENLREYIFLEYAAGGELFQLIEPDIGMPSHSAQMYMKQLLCGVDYLHTHGITHRDIKPENLLLSEDGTLKISDFGMATLFRHKGRERLLDKKCGTKPYLAPEVLQRPYRAQPADLWSCGIVLVAMLTGELPWSEPVDTSEEFLKWKRDVYVSETPWSKLGNTALSLARKIINVDSKKRLTLQEILNHPWMKFDFGYANDSDLVDSSTNPSNHRWHSMVENETKVNNREIPQVTLSQPIHINHNSSLHQVLKEIITNCRDTKSSFSQPIHNEDLMLHMTQSPVTNETFHSLIKRMTRFYVTTNWERTLQALSQVLESANYSWNTGANGAVTISAIDVHKNPLIFKIILLDMDGKILLDFRFSKGCGLEFKKKFLKIKEALKDIVHNTS